MDKFALFIKKRLKDTFFGDIVINFFRIRGIDEKLFVHQTKKQYIRESLNPSKDMIDAKSFFATHKQQIRKVMSCLSDDESKECFQRCIEYRCTHNIERAPKNTKGRYFVKGIINIQDNEVFVDGGGFVGDTVKEFVKKSKGRYKKIIAFEPDEYNFRMLSKLKYRDVIKINKGLWSKNCKLHFSNGGGCGSRMSEEAVSSVKVVKLDDIPQCADATFIKMDIEGSELNALKGAERIIRDNHPKLAICIYHSNEDMLDIIEYIHEIEPRYHLYVRHHSQFIAETVMYAVF